MWQVHPESNLMLMNKVMRLYLFHFKWYIAVLIWKDLFSNYTKKPKAKDKRKLEKLQERALHIVFNSNSFTYDELLKKSNLSTLYNRLLQDISITMFKYRMGLIPTYLSDTFVTKSLKYNLRTENDIPNFNTVRYGKHSIRYFGPYLWSKLPKESRNITSLKTLTSRIRKTNIEELAGNSNCQNCYLCHSLFLVLVFLYTLHHYIYNLKHFISVCSCCVPN